MPRGDGTGSMGLGSMTGRVAGYCSGYTVPGFVNPAFRFGFGWGSGRGFRRRFWATRFPGWVFLPEFTAATPPMPAYHAFYSVDDLDPAIEARMLTSQIEMMEQSLKNAKERLNELQKSGE